MAYKKQRGPLARPPSTGISDLLISISIAEPNQVSSTLSTRGGGAGIGRNTNILDRNKRENHWLIKAKGTSKWKPPSTRISDTKISVSIPPAKYIASVLSTDHDSGLEEILV